MTTTKGYNAGRPLNYPHDQPDPKEFRCPKCNTNGWNKTGNIGTGFLQTKRYTTILGYKCPYCEDGWKID